MVALTLTLPTAGEVSESELAALWATEARTRLAVVGLKAVLPPSVVAPNAKA